MHAWARRAPWCQFCTLYFCQFERGCAISNTCIYQFVKGGRGPRTPRPRMAPPAPGDDRSIIPPSSLEGGGAPLHTFGVVQPRRVAKMNPFDLIDCAMLFTEIRSGWIRYPLRGGFVRVYDMFHNSLVAIFPSFLHVRRVEVCWRPRCAPMPVAQATRLSTFCLRDSLSKIDRHCCRGFSCDC